MYYEGNGVVQSHNETVEWFRKAADQGQVEAQQNSDCRHRPGKGVPKSELLWYQMAAAQGNSKTQQ